MLKIKRRTFPLEKEGELNRLRAEVSLLNGTGKVEPFTAIRAYQPGEAISYAGRIYKTNTVIVAGETVTPGDNATETSIEEIVNALNALNAKGE